MRFQTCVGVAAASLLFAACAPLLSHVRVHGDRSDVAAIAGNWNGEYHSDELGRSGSILFRFASPEDSAFGDVLMVVAPKLQNVASIDPARPSMPVAPRTQVLRIKFVDVVDGQVFGVLEPYTDPDCECTVRTTFSGQLDGHTMIRGKFSTTNPVTASVRTGEWSVSKL